MANTEQIGETPRIPPVIEPVRPSEIDFSHANVSERYDDVYEVVRPDQVVDVRWQEGAYLFQSQNGVALRVQVISPGIFRIRYAPDGIFERDFSYALDAHAKPEKVTVILNENEQEYLLSSELLQIVIKKSDMALRFFDLDDQVLCEDAEGFSARRTIMKGWANQRISKKWFKKESFYGLGDKSALGANLSGKKFELWCTDAYAFGAETDPLYKAIPFYYALHSGIAYGIFLDSPFRTHFDFNSQGTETTEFEVEGGEINYYFIYGPTLTDVSCQYARLTGTAPMPPLWALGYHQSRWSYLPDSRFIEIADQFRALQIPCDALYFDIDYMDHFKCFTWNKALFPDPGALMAQLNEKGFHTVAMIDPGIKEDRAYAVYREGIEQHYFLKTADGQVAKAPVWPGFCAFPDFTRPDVRQWWGNLYAEMYVKMGLSGFWNDMNDPAVFHVNHKTLPDDIRHDYDGNPCSHKKAHNIYGMQMARASFEGLQNLQPEKRPFLLSRATFAGGQRYGAVWTGDNLSDWDHLQIANLQCQRLSISGFSFCGTDIGGFAGEPEGELFVRWLQLSVFHPYMRVHSKGYHLSGDSLAVEEEDALALEVKPHNNLDQEPWAFGEKYTPLAKQAIELRYCLLPVLYTAFWKNHTTGMPIIRHLSWADPRDPKFWNEERDFLFGDHLLVSPVIQPKVQRQMVNLPRGKWYYFWTGQAYQSEAVITLAPDQIPFFVREGGVLPVWPIQQWTGQRDQTELTLYVYYKNGRELSELYEDAGDGYGYQEEQFCLTTWETEGSSKGFSVIQTVAGKMTSRFTTAKIYMIGLPFFAKNCSIDGKETPIKEIRLRDRSLYTITVPIDFHQVDWTE